MSLYVLLLRKGDGLSDEIRYHDRPLKVGDPVRVDGSGWVVSAIEDTAGRLLDPSGAEVSALYTCTRADHQSVTPKRNLSS